MRKERKHNSIVTRCIAFILMGVMCFGLAACEADTVTDDTEVAETEKTEAEETTLEDGEYVYFTMYELPDGISEAEIDSSSYGDDYYIVLVDTLTALAEETSEDVVFEDVNGNIVTISADGAYTSDTGKAIIKTVIVKNGTITRSVTSSVSVDVTDAEDKIEEDTAEDEGTDVSNDIDTSSSSSSGDSSSFSSGSSSGSSSSSGNSSSSSGYYVEMVWSSDSDDDEEEETECSHSWAYTYTYDKVFDHYEYECYCGEYFYSEEEFDAHLAAIKTAFLSGEITAAEREEHNGWVEIPVTNTVKTVTRTCSKCGVTETVE